MIDIKRRRLLAVLEILKNTDWTTPLNAKEISDILLSDYDIYSERQAILADINALKNAGYDIVTCRYKRQGYHMDSHLFMNYEAKILIDAVNSSKFMNRKNMDELISKLYSTLPDAQASVISKITPKITETGNTGPSARAVASIKNDALANIHVVLMSIQFNHMICFNYCNISSDLTRVPRHDGKDYMATPYMLYWDQGFYYVACCDEDEPHKLKTYRLDKMSKLHSSLTPAISADEALGPNHEEILRQYVENSIHHYSGSEKILLMLKVPDFMLDYLFDEFGENLISVKAEEDGNIATIHIPYSAGLKFLLLQYGENLEVIGPPKVREEYIEALHKIINKYT